MKICNRLFQWFSWGVIAAIVIYMAIAAPILLGYRPMVVLSGSMQPTYPVGSIIYYHSCEFEDLKVGDPVTFHAGNSMVTHRITTVNQISETVMTKGDNNDTEDPAAVEAYEIAGKATDFAIPFAGYFVTWGKHPAVIAAMAVILLLNYILEGLVSEQKKGEEKDETGKKYTIAKME